MKRVLDLIRNILIETEESDFVKGFLIPEIQGYTSDEIAYNIKLLYQAGYLEIFDFCSKDKFSFGIKSLTWNGHEFLDASRSPQRWKKLKDNLGGKIGTLSFDMIKSVLQSYIKIELGLEE